MPRPPTTWTTSRRDAVVAAVILAAATFLLLTGTAADGDRKPGVERPELYRDAEAGIEATIPPGWRAVDRPLDTVIYPPQVLAAASFAGAAPPRPARCSPDEALREMPPGGAMVQIREYAPRNPFGEPIDVPELPAAPAHLAYSDAHHGVFECAGEGYNFTFELDGRAFQAHIWMDPDTVDPANRAKALRVLNSFHPSAG